VLVIFLSYMMGEEIKNPPPSSCVPSQSSSSPRYWLQFLQLLRGQYVVRLDLHPLLPSDVHHGVAFTKRITNPTTPTRPTPGDGDGFMVIVIPAAAAAAAAALTLDVPIYKSKSITPGTSHLYAWLVPRGLHTVTPRRQEGAWTACVLTDGRGVLKAHHDAMHVIEFVVADLDGGLARCGGCGVTGCVRDWFGMAR
jgi:hypothetical protein